MQLEKQDGLQDLKDMLRDYEKWEKIYHAKGLSFPSKKDLIQDVKVAEELETIRTTAEILSTGATFVSDISGILNVEGLKGSLTILQKAGGAAAMVGLIADLALINVPDPEFQKINLKLDAISDAVAKLVNTINGQFEY